MVPPSGSHSSLSPPSSAASVLGGGLLDGVLGLRLFSLLLVRLRDLLRLPRSLCSRLESSFLSFLLDLDLASFSRTFSFSLFNSDLFSSTSTKGSLFLRVSLSDCCSSLTSVSVVVTSPSRRSVLRSRAKGGKPRPLLSVPPSSFTGGGASPAPEVSGSPDAFVPPTQEPLAPDLLCWRIQEPRSRSAGPRAPAQALSCKRPRGSAPPGPGPRLAIQGLVAPTPAASAGCKCGNCTPPDCAPAGSYAEAKTLQ